MVEVQDEDGDIDVARSALTCAAAREALTRRLRPRVYRLACSFLRNAADAEDATQAALLEILRAMPSFRGESKLETWADRITVRATIRLARTRRLAAVRRHDTVDPDELTELSAESSSADALPRSLMAYLDALSEQRRTVLVLRHALGHSVQEIAELTGVSENTVKDRLLAARNEVRRMVRQEVAVPGRAERRRGERP